MGGKTGQRTKKIYFASTALAIVNAASLLDGKMEMIKYKVFCIHIDNAMLYSGFNMYLKICSVTWQDLATANIKEYLNKCWNFNSGNCKDKHIRICLNLKHRLKSNLTG